MKKQSLCEMWVCKLYKQRAGAIVSYHRCCLTVKQMWGGSVLKTCQKLGMGKESLFYADSSLPAVSGVRTPRSVGPVARKLFHHSPPVQSGTWRLAANEPNISKPTKHATSNRQTAFYCTIFPKRYRSLHSRLMAASTKSTWTTLPEMDKWRYHAVISLKQANWMKIIKMRADTVVELKNYQHQTH